MAGRFNTIVATVVIIVGAAGWVWGFMRPLFRERTHFGTQQKSLKSNYVYPAETDGFVTATYDPDPPGDGVGELKGLVFEDGKTYRMGWTFGSACSITFPVKKGQSWQIVLKNTDYEIYWTPVIHQ